MRRKMSLAYLGKFILTIIVCLAVLTPVPTSGGEGVRQTNGEAKGHVAELQQTCGRLPLHFEANQGQADAAVQYLARGPGYTLFLTPGEAVLVLRLPADKTRPGPSSLSTLPAEAEARRHKEGHRDGTGLRLQLVGANPAPQVQGRQPLPGKSHYLKGSDPHQWRTQIPHYAQVHYQELYPGIDLVYYGNQRQVEFDFIVQPGADPGAIRLAVEGADTLALEAQGDLLVQTGGGEVRLRQPLIYQEVDGSRRPIAGRYVLSPVSPQADDVASPPAQQQRPGKRHVGFALAAYDASRPVIIDPVLVYSTYLGGSTGGDLWPIR